MTGETTAELDRSQRVLLGVFGRPRLKLVGGQGCTVVDADGRRYLDLLGGIAVSCLGHGHPALVAAIQKAAGFVHTSTFFVTPAQIQLGEKILRLARELTTQHGALLAFDEIQTGIGRTRRWFDHQRAGVQPDVMSLAKGLAGGVPIGAIVTFGERVSGLLVGIELSEAIAPAALQDAGFIVNPVKPTALRLAPVLTLTDTFVTALARVLDEVPAPQAPEEAPR